MNLLDTINGCFEAGGAVSSVQNCRRLIRDRQIAGVDWRTMGFFAAWGWWNLLYYPALGQWLSTAGGAVLVLSNTTWVALAIRWRRGPKFYTREELEERARCGLG